ncbi:MAG: hypothetical protein ACJ8AI_09785 [Rhodopila sp.]|jgi:hypothetical protein
MALVDDVLKGNLLIAAAIGATALVLPKIMPDLSPPLRAAIKGGLSLLLESESEAEGGIIERLADTALKNVLAHLSGPGSPTERRDAARTAIADYKRTARVRARRYARDDEDRSARRNRHIDALRHKLHRARTRATGTQAQDLESLVGALDDTGQA